MKQIRIKISPDGQTEAETLGMHGKECLKYVTILEKLANAVATDSEFTKEYTDVSDTAGVTNEEEVHA